MKQKKLLFLTMVLWILAALAFTNVPVQAPLPEVRIIAHAAYLPGPYIPGVPPGPIPAPPPIGNLVVVDLYIDTTFGDYTPQGIVQWAISAKVDPDVLEPMGATGAGPGYFMYDFMIRYYLNYLGYTDNLLPPVADPTTGELKQMSEAIVGTPPLTSGAGMVPGQMPYKLVTLTFLSKSEFDYSPIDLFYEEGIDAWYWTGESGAEGIPVPVVVDGHYNLPPDAHTMDAMGMVIPPAPLGSDWHELEPNFSTEWSLESWEDNGDGILSASDQVDMQHAGLPAPVWFHVEWVSPVIIANDGIPDMMVRDKAVPEFPLGSVAPIALIAVVAYIWWVTRRKRLEVT